MERKEEGDGQDEGKGWRSVEIAPRRRRVDTVTAKGERERRRVGRRGELGSTQIFPSTFLMGFLNEPQLR